MTAHVPGDVPAEPSTERQPDYPQRALSAAKSLIDLLGESFREWNLDNARQLGAALAFYTALALAPLLVLLVVATGQLLGESAAGEEIVALVSIVLSPEAATVIEAIIQNAKASTSSVAATAVSLGVLLFAASSMLAQLRRALNRVWSIEPGPGGGIMRTIRSRLIAVAVTLVAGTILIGILALDTAAGALNERFGTFVALPDLADLIRIVRTLQAVKFFVLFGLFTPLFAVIFKTVPDAELAWKDAWIGGAVTSLLFTLGNFAMGIYLRYSSVGSAYGAAGSLVVFLVLMYYYAQAFLLGAEFTKVYANRFGSRILPDENAVRVVRQRRTRQEVVQMLEQGSEAGEQPTRPPAAVPQGGERADGQSDE